MVAVRISAVLLVCVIAPAIAEASPIYFVSTAMDGPQVQLDVNHPLFWTIIPKTGTWFEFGGGIFGLKEAPNTTGSTTLSLWSGAPVAGTLLATMTLSQMQFETLHTGGATHQDFAPVQYSLSMPFVELQPGYRYTIALTSTALDAANHQYFAKTPATVLFLDADGNPIENAPAWAFGPGTNVPEPSSWALLAAGIALAAVPRIRRAA